MTDTSNIGESGDRICESLREYASLEKHSRHAAACMGYAASEIERLRQEVDKQAATIAKQAARIAELEGLGPLIDHLREATSLHADYARRGITIAAERWAIDEDETVAKIDAILEGGS